MYISILLMVFCLQVAQACSYSNGIGEQSIGSCTYYYGSQSCSQDKFVNCSEIFGIYSTNLSTCDSHCQGVLTLGIIIAAVVSSIIVVVCFIVIACVCWRRCQIQRIKIFRQAQLGGSAYRLSQMPQAQVGHINMFQNGVQDHQVIKSVKNEVCPICLESGTNIKTNCNHFYHKKCLIACLSRKFECSLCRNQQIFPCRVYCEICYKKFIEVSELNASSIEKCVDCVI